MLLGFLTLFAILIIGGLSNFYIGMTDYITNIATTINFSIYGILIGGAIYNRKSKSHEIDKEKLFYPTSIFSILLISWITIINAYDVVDKVFFADDSTEVYLRLTLIMVLFSIIALLIIFNEMWFKINPKKVSERKQIIVNTYYNNTAFKDIDFDQERKKMKEERLKE